MHFLMKILQLLLQVINGLNPQLSYLGNKTSLGFKEAV